MTNKRSDINGLAPVSPEPAHFVPDNLCSRWRLPQRGHKPLDLTPLRCIGWELTQQYFGVLERLLTSTGATERPGQLEPSLVEVTVTGERLFQVLNGGSIVIASECDKAEVCQDDGVAWLERKCVVQCVGRAAEIARRAAAARQAETSVSRWHLRLQRAPQVGLGTGASAGSQFGEPKAQMCLRIAGVVAQDGFECRD